MSKHNLTPCGPSLPLSEVGIRRYALDVLPPVGGPEREIGAGGRLTETVPRYLRLVGSRRRRYPVGYIARRIEEDGSVWGVVVELGISYSHACRIRAGWRPRDVA
jgi:hypothetical protein